MATSIVSSVFNIIIITQLVAHPCSASVHVHMSVGADFSLFGSCKKRGFVVNISDMDTVVFTTYYFAYFSLHFSIHEWNNGLDSRRA